MTDSPFRRAFNDGLPIFLGYFSASLAFGLLARSTGLSFLEATVFSMTAFTGAAQFMALRLISAGVNPFELILSFVLMNFRYFLMSASLSQKVEISKPILRFPLAFGITDEVFSVAALKPGSVKPRYLAWLEVIPYTGWVSGTALGFLFGALFPPAVQMALEGSLYAFFAALLVPEIKKKFRTLFIALFAGGLNTSLVYFTDISLGWSFVLAMTSGALAGTALEFLSVPKDPLPVEEDNCG